ncbi:hypothetical protein D1007_24183 [Hordeum vulgare]|nr:hypothetical protein D1007_24183 [Hordeum vulgare]
MAERVASLATVALQLASLELDIKAIHSNREEDRKEFQDFRTMVNKNFATMQSNFAKIQENFRRLLVEPGSDEGQVERSEQGSAQMKGQEALSPGIPPGRPKQLVHNTPPSVQGQDKEAPVVVGSVVLRDHTGKEVNLHGTSKMPYRHPNFTSNRQEGIHQMGHQQ